ncbi:unnamed protein product [Mytilus coruscus]|uniref:Mutator-like transposase domain-containing protein n=1 Tax=Mytilus coruscus TaxID=42192 RepID=A0A6J8A488_MYTCO|nr:unnamed protein product [Mytilus coruscus]
MSRKETVRSHDCSKNWQGTSKGMEPEMVLEMTHNLKDNECLIHVLHADNDSTTTARLKELKNPDVIPYLFRCFMYAIKENNDSSESIKRAFRRLVLHIFGDHTSCTDAEWCTYKNDLENFRFYGGSSSLSNSYRLSVSVLQTKEATHGCQR